MIRSAVRNSIRGSGRQAYPHQVARALPRTGLLLYLGRPNLEAADVPIGGDTEIGDDTIIRWKFLLPADADIRAATGWLSGTGNIFYDAAGDPIDVFASEIAAWSSTNQWNVLFHLVSADTETGRLAIYDPSAVSFATLTRAYKVLREDQNTSGVTHTTPFIDQIGANTRTLYGLQYVHLTGPTDFTNATIVGTETITSQPAGTAAITVAAGKLTIGAGDLWTFALSNGSTYEFGTVLTATTGVVFDTSGHGRHLLFSAADTSVVCLSGSREKGSDWLDIEGWTLSDGENYAALSNGSKIIPINIPIPALSDLSGCVAYQYVAPTEVFTISIPTDGWYALVSVPGVVGGAIDVGTDSSPKFKINLSSKSWTDAGTESTLARTVYGKIPMRKPYPNQLQRDESASDGLVTFKMVLNDYVYAGDTVTSVEIAAGFFTNSGSGGDSHVSLAETHTGGL